MVGYRSCMGRRARPDYEKRNTTQKGNFIVFEDATGKLSKAVRGSLVCRVATPFPRIEPTMLLRSRSLSFSFIVSRLFLLCSSLLPSIHASAAPRYDPRNIRRTLPRLYAILKFNAPKKDRSFPLS